jgi:hypothetical protein
VNIDSRSWRRLGAALITVAVLAGVYLALSVSGALAYLREPEALQEMLLSLGRCVECHQRYHAARLRYLLGRNRYRRTA